MKKDEIMKVCKQKNVKFINFQFCDILGTVKSLTNPVSKLEDAIENNIWFDGSSVEGFARIFESDMYLKPDLSTFSIVPWESDEQGTTARIICDVFLPDGSPFLGDPRQILRQQIEKAKKLGFDYFVGPELEFFLFPLDEEKNPILKPHDNAGYFDYSTDKGKFIRQVMSDVVSQMGIDVETIHHEVSPGQQEIDFKYSDAISQADAVLTVKSALRAVAGEFDLHATFIPKPIAGVNGSGMHVHQSLGKNNKNAFFDSKNEYQLSKIALQFIAGQLKYLPEICAITSPIVNSYKRLVPGYEAPVYIACGQTNRSALIRIPRITKGKPEATRCELRCPDPAANPYLAFAVMLGAGLAGIEEKLQEPKPIEENIFEFTDKKAKRMRIKNLPGSLGEAVNNLEKSKLAKEVLGEHIFKKYVEAKKMEFDEFRLSVSEWEINKYIENY